MAAPSSVQPRRAPAALPLLPPSGGATGVATPSSAALSHAFGNLVVLSGAVSPAPGPASPVGRPVGSALDAASGSGGGGRDPPFSRHSSSNGVVEEAAERLASQLDEARAGGEVPTPRSARMAFEGADAAMDRPAAHDSSGGGGGGYIGVTDGWLSGSGAARR